MRKFTDSHAPRTARNDVRPMYRPEQPRNSAFENTGRKYPDISRRANREVPAKNIYEQPAWRAGMRDTVWEQAKAPTGEFVTP